ncbi:phosphate transport system substrate-binding protein [Inquilinus ginsengisoli]|uniref:phosphate ABC transporter substrate-binding protein PstS n=1 Tax=Inquilinus ginsengisoli TaxID=363840 RepID=UPI003D21DE59
MSAFSRIHRAGFTRRLTVMASAVIAAAVVTLASTHDAAAQRVQGSGSTFAFPVISAWAKGFLEFRAGDGDFLVDDRGIDYEPIGSLGGIMRLAQPEVDFATSDAPLPPADLAARGLAQFPVVIGGLAAVVNLDRIKAGELKLGGDVLAGIYLGRITRWNDPAIAALNQGLALPDQAIAVLHRADGSGSTLVWTRYLSASSPEWKDSVGSDTRVRWPAGAAAEGSSGMLDAVRRTKGAIGYVEFGQVGRAGLIFAQLGNAGGRFITPSPEVFAATAARAAWDPAKGFYLHLTDAAEPDAYPLTAATFVLMHKTQRSAARTRRTLAFLDYALGQGGPQAAALGYVALPPELVERVRDYWRANLPGAEAF